MITMEKNQFAAHTKYCGYGRWQPKGEGGKGFADNEGQGNFTEFCQTKPSLITDSRESVCQTNTEASSWQEESKQEQ